MEKTQSFSVASATKVTNTFEVMREYVFGILKETCRYQKKVDRANKIEQASINKYERESLRRESKREYARERKQEIRKV